MTEVYDPPTVDPDTIMQGFYRDFLLSFRFSQGNASSQEYEYRLLANQYLDALDPAERRWVMRQGYSVHWLRLCKVRPPEGSHRPLFTDGEETARLESKKFGGIVRAVLYGGEVQDELGLQTKFLLETAKSDLLWSEGKPRGHGPDRRISYLREYIICGQPTGSPNFDAIFTDIRQNFDDQLRPGASSHIGGHLVDLAAAWESNHPGQSFWPDGRV